MTPNGLEIDTQDDGGTNRKVMRLSGKLSLETVSSFNQTARAETAPLVILDMSPLAYLDSAGVGALVQFQVRCARSGQQLILAGLTPKVFAVLQVANVLSLFRVVPNANEATS